MAWSCAAMSSERLAKQAFMWVLPGRRRREDQGKVGIVEFWDVKALGR